MSVTETIDKGTAVRFTAKNLGTVRYIDATGFTDVVVNSGDYGTYLMRHPNKALAGWHLIAVEHSGETLYVPCGVDHFEVTS